MDKAFLRFGKCKVYEMSEKPRTNGQRVGTSYRFVTCTSQTTIDFKFDALLCETRRILFGRRYENFNCMLFLPPN